MSIWVDSLGKLIVDSSGRPMDCPTCPCVGGDPDGVIECDSNPGVLMHEYQTVKATLGSTIITRFEGADHIFTTGSPTEGVPGWQVDHFADASSASPNWLCGGTDDTGVKVTEVVLGCVGVEGEWYMAIRFEIYYLGINLGFVQISTNSSQSDIALTVLDTDPFHIIGEFNFGQLVKQVFIDAEPAEAEDGSYAVPFEDCDCDDPDCMMTVEFYEET